MYRYLVPTAAAVLLSMPTAGLAAKVKVWHHSVPSQFEKARLKHAVISSEGALRLSRQLKPLAGIDATHVWDVVEDKDGNLFVATGDDGKIFKVASDGKITVAYAGEESQILCLALAADGSIYAGTGPKGRIYQLTPEGKASVFYTTKQEHILCLALAGDGMLYAGTDKNGLVYRIDPKGKGFVVYNAPQSEIRSLLVTADAVYAGTSSPSRRRLRSG